MRIALLLAFSAVLAGCSQPAPPANPSPPRTLASNVFVHLFTWRWPDVARECEEFLGPNGYEAVQVSPPHEHAILEGRPWYEMYQPVSYTIGSRNGNREEYRDMVERCQAAGVAIYADAVINHMAALEQGTGSAGTAFTHYAYEGLYDYDDFHHCDTEYGDIHDYQNAWEVQHCELVNLADLRTETDSVQDRIAGYLNDLVGLGTAGFRIDAAKHMPPEDIQSILSRLNGTSYIFQEVIDHGSEPITASMYTGNGDVTEFKYAGAVSHHFINNTIASLQNLSAEAMLPGDTAVVFIDNHDNQRGHGGAGSIVTHKDSSRYVLANVFMLAYPYGYPKVMSSYAFTDNSQGPPIDEAGITLPVYVDNQPDCFGDRWQCEHRWPAIVNMVAFRKAAASVPTVDNWWSDGDNQIAFSRGNEGFVAINNSNAPLQATLQTGLPPGVYCDLVRGGVTDGSCTGPELTVQDNGTAVINLPSMTALAISSFSRVSDS